MISIAIVGRPNVGKSALFNRLLQKRIAIVAPSSGITRDRIYGQLEWSGALFNLIDTGGVDFDTSSSLRKQILEQIKGAISESQLLIFVTDVTKGVVPLDKEVGRLLRKGSKPVIVTVNKVDNEKLLEGVNDFYRLGWDEVIGISAVHGLGINTLLDKVIQKLPDLEEEVQESESSLKVAVIGRPNVGKSTLVNTVCEQARMIVDEKPGTTRDAVDIKVIKGNKTWLFIDTGGMHRRKRLKSAVDYYSTQRAYTTIRRSDVVVLMIDAWEGMVEQDAKLLDYITERGKGCVIGVNKWDLVTEVAKGQYRERIYRRLPKHSYVPAVFLSAINGENINKLLRTVEYVYRGLRQKVPTKLLNKILQQLVRSRIYYGTQVGTCPPEFLLFAKNPGEIKQKQLGYLTNQLRQAFGFEGVPIRWKLRKR